MRQLWTMLAALQAGSVPETPAAVIRQAVAAVEGDSAERVRQAWSRRLARDSSDRMAALGLAAIAQITYEDSLADRLYGSLLPAPGGTPDAAGGYAAINLARMAGLRGLWPRADSLGALGAAAGRAVADSALTAEALVLLGTVRNRRLGPIEAHATLDSADAVAPERAFRVRGLIHCTRAQVLSFAGDGRALDVAYAGVELAGRAPDFRTRATCLNVAAAELGRRALLDSALAVYGRLITDYRRAKDRAGLAVALQWRSHLYRLVGFLARAKWDAEEAITEAEASGAFGVIPWARSTLALVAFALGDVATAVPHATEAARLFEAQGDRYASTTALGLQSDLAAHAGDRARARALLTEALARASALGWAETAVTFHRGLVHVALADGDLGSAERELAAAESLARARGMVGFLKSAVYYQGILALRAGRLEEAERRFRAHRDDVIDEQPHFRYLSSARLAEVLVRLGRVGEAAEELVSANVALDEWRNSLRDRELRLLALQLAEDRSDPDLGVATVVAALAEGSGPQLWAGFELAERQRARALADRLNRSAALDTTTERAARSIETVSYGETAEALPDDSTALLLYVTGLGGEPTTAFALTRRGGVTYRLAPVDSLTPMVARWSALLESSDDHRALGRELARALLDPFVATFPATVRRLVIVPDGALNRIPFDALILEDGRHVLERFTVATAPSATVAVRLWERAPATPAPEMLVLADPRFAGETGVAADAKVFRSAVAGGGGLPRLRGSSREARNVARYADEPTVRRRADASESWLKRAPLARFGLVHFATHALVDEASAANTALALAPGAGDDGFLGPSEIVHLRLAAELVVLSACRTAGGVLVRGEGVQGLAAPLIEAGARAVAATWWPVGDVATIRLVDDFYGAMAAGLAAGDALREAKLAALTRGAPAREWAAFTIVGDPLARPSLRPAPTRRAPALFALFAGALALLAVYSIVTRRRRVGERG
jgi:CHAT domain-containing protein/tetratricopeptide (TPR) repeat protein